MLSIILSYFNQKNALVKHLEMWNSYDLMTKNKLEIIIIDDCSLQHPALSIINETNYEHLDIKCFRVIDDLYCNISGARNLGCKVSTKDFIIILDMDTLIDNIMIKQLTNICENYDGCIHRFNRKSNIPNHKK